LQKITHFKKFTKSDLTLNTRNVLKKWIILNDELQKKNRRKKEKRKNNELQNEKEEIYKETCLGE
jgi:hypothetical protein